MEITSACLMYPDHSWGMVIGIAHLHGSNLVFISFYSQIMNIKAEHK